MKQVHLLMSGGVDSSVAACLLLEQGYQVIGCHMKLFTFGSPLEKNESWIKVQEVSKKLGITCHLLDLAETFKEKVVDPFIDSYQRGQTPNPCVRCNKAIKFGAFYEYARNELKTDYIASGHYARIVQNRGLLGLAKAVDTKKDQSYFLYQLDQDILNHLILPLGNLTKPQVRELAVKFSLTTDFGKESEDVCFFPGNFKSFISGYIPDQAGNITNQSGKILGQHKGIHFFTVGQRQGLGIASQHPLYVTKIDPCKNVVIVGTKEEAYQTELFLSTVHWVGGKEPPPRTHIKAKVRYRGEEKTCRIQGAGDGFKVLFDEPQFAITQGQSIVFYEDEQVLGGGVIDGNNDFGS